MRTTFLDIVGTRPLIGMVHLLPLPGAPGWAGSMQDLLVRAVSDARTIENGGLDAIMVENYGDLPFYPGAVPPETVAALTVAVTAVIEATSLPVGVNVLRNDAAAALAIATATGARFIRVNVHTGAMLTDQGWISGHAHETLRKRASLGADVAILADVFVKHATPPAGTSIEESARDTWERGQADALIVSGSGTGRPVDLEQLARVRAVVPTAPLLIGSGLTPENAATLLQHADGAIVGSAIQEGGIAGRPIDPTRVAALRRVVL